MNSIVAFCRASVSVILIAALFAPSMHHWGDGLFHSHGTAEHGHQHESQCNAEAEKDPCHRKLVHHDETADCAHDAHLSTNYIGCLLCSVAPLRYEGTLNEQVESVTCNEPCIEIFSEGQEAFISAFLTSNESRGPPCCPVLT